MPYAPARERPGDVGVWEKTYGRDGLIEPQATLASVRELGFTGIELPARLLRLRPALRMLDRHADRLPLDRLVTHLVGLDDVGAALEPAQRPAAMKSLVTPGGQLRVPSHGEVSRP
jgi:hypothetical protein